MPYGPPQDFNVTASSPDMLMLEWAPPTSQDINGVIQHYNVTVRENSTGNAFSSILTTSLSVDIHGLHPFYIYTCKVFAVTIGPGPSSTLIIQMPEDSEHITVVSVCYMLFL